MTRSLTNRLNRETSPYLLQHADNPVAWQGWNAESLATARELDLPILLSIGYSACHWCHVMEHESFQDTQTADFMNEHFVCIKVDREERPDLDKIYQLAHHMLTRRAGGWPLNVVLSPDSQAPFFAGTYFPEQPRHGMVSFQQVLHRVTEYFQQHRNELDQHASELKQAFASTEPTGPGTINAETLDQAVTELEENFDEQNGGFGAAPKFPHPTTINLCLHHWQRDAPPGEQNRAGEMAHLTLQKMACGGLLDQLGGGFYRYSVDAAWTVPHFEKMLYDNAQLLNLYTDAWHLYQDPLFRNTAAATARWVMGQMQADSGGYYSSIDADSEGEEGKFYVWTTDEIRRCLTPLEFTAMSTLYGLKGTPNFEGKWHLNRVTTTKTVAESVRLEIDQTEALLESANKKLLNKRSRRQPPQVDDKILTAWNAMMIHAMARAGRVLDEADFIQSAEAALAFTRKHLYRNNRLLATAREQRAHLNGYLDDYVFLIGAILELNRCRWRSDEIALAIELANTVITQFEDQDLGGFFFTSNDHENLLHRSKPAADEATPSGNGVATAVLLHLGHLVGDIRYLKAAERTLRLFAPTLSKRPSAYGSMVLAMEEHLRPSAFVVLRGQEPTMTDWTHRLTKEHCAGIITVPVPIHEQNLPGILQHMHPAGEITAYICRGTACSAPVNRFEELVKHVTEK